jgi:DDE superfamily endonuclease
MAPLARRTWAPRGQTPVLQQRGKHREKVAVAAALWLPARRDRLGLFFQTLVDAYFNNERVAPFLEALLDELGGRLVVVWDGGTVHKGDPIKDLLGRVGDRLELERFPPYAPLLAPYHGSGSLPGMRQAFRVRMARSNVGRKPCPSRRLGVLTSCWPRVRENDGGFAGMSRP